MTILFIILGTIWIACLYFLFRNGAVYDERGRMIDWVYEQPDWEEKTKLLRNPSYDEMVFKFWKPVKSFYKDYLG